MRTRTILTFALSVIVGGSVALMMARALRNEARAGSTMVVVAAHTLKPGTALRPGDLNEIAWPAGKLPNGTFSHKSELLVQGGRVVATAIDKDEPLMSWKLGAPIHSLTAELNDDLRAVSIRVDDVRGVAGFVLPNERVDVLLSRQAIGGRLTSEILLRNVRALAVDQQTNDGQQRPTVARTITLAVTLEQAQKLVLAGAVGTLSLALRRPEADDSKLERTLSVSDLDGMAPDRPEAPVSNDTGLTSIGILRGTARSVYDVPRAGAKAGITASAGADPAMSAIEPDRRR